MNPTTVNARRSFLILLSLLGIAFYFLLEPFFMAVILAAILALLFYPVYLFFLRLFRNRRNLASFTSTLLIFLMLVLPFSFIIILVMNQAIEILPNLDPSEIIASVNSTIFFQEYVQPTVILLEKNLHITVDMAGLFRKLGVQVARYVYNFSPQVLGHTATFIFGFFVMHVSLYVLFIEGKNVSKTIFDLSPIEERHEKSLTREFKNMIHATVYGYLLTALVQALLAAIGFALAGVKGFLIFAALTFFMSMVPVVGATSVWLPIAVWYFIQGMTGWGIFLVIYGVVLISGIDNIIKPWIMRGKAKIHILLIFFSLLGGIHLFGPIGILFGPVITALFLACIRIYREDFLEKREF